MTSFTVVAAGIATTVQDAGRPGLGAIGVGASGPLDRPLHALCNRIVGNPEGAAALETAGGLRLRADTPVVIALSAELAPRALAAGDEVRIDPRPDEQWAYLAVRGGVVVPAVLGSRSRDTLAGLGPAPPVVGDVLPVGSDPGRTIVADVAPRPRRGEAILRIWPGPRADWIGGDAVSMLGAQTWTVTADVSRVGVRLAGPTLARREGTGELPTEALVLGAIQLPPDGRPVVMLADHPTTGGYPVIAVVDRRSIPDLVHARPGTAVRMRASWP